MSTFEAHLGSTLEVKNHFDNTPIPDDSTYIGKEHFWMLLSDDDVTQNQITRLYQSVAFPWLRRSGPSERKGEFPIDPEELGIEVANRQDVGIPYPPFALSSLMRNMASTKVIGRHQARLGHMDDETGRVVRVGSLISFADKLRGPGFIEGMPTRIKLSGLGPGGVLAAHLMADNLRMCIDQTEQS